MSKRTLFAVLLCGLGWAGPRPPVVRKKLAAATEIQGYPCATGYAWFYLDGHLEQCAVSRDTAFGEAQAPAGSIVVLLPSGQPDYLMMSHDVPILGYKCAGGGPLGPAEGAMTAFYPSGKLKLCWLVGDQNVQGIPCMGNGGFFGALLHYGGAGARFYRSGKLHSCTLSKDVGGLRRGQLFVAP